VVHSRPIPDNPLRYVSAYAFGTGPGLVLIDAGGGSEQSWRSLLTGLESIGAATMALADRLLTDGELADVPGWKLRAVHTPGHTRGTCASWTSGSADCSPATTCCPGSPRTSPGSGPRLLTRSGTTSTRWPGRVTSTWTRSCPRTSGGSWA